MAENIAARIIDEDEPLSSGPGIDGGNNIASDGATERNGTLPDNVRQFQPVANFGGIPLVNPLSVGTAPSSDRAGIPGTRRRGRPPGSTNRPRDTSETQADLSLRNSLTNIEDLLTSIHWGTARLLDMSELELSADDSRQLSRAIKECLRHYQFNIDPKKMALGNLLMVAGGIYGPRAVAIYRRGMDSKPTPKVEAIKETRTGTTGNVKANPGPVAVPNLAPRNAAARVPSDLDLSPLIDGFES